VKKDAPQGVAARDADTEMLRAAAPVPFRITALHRVAYGSKIAEFSIETPLGVIEADLFIPEGREPFVQARSVRDKFTGQWRRTVALDRTFAARVLDALRARATATKERRVEQRSQCVEPSKVLLESECRFDNALSELDAADGAR
jgi:hypothetical protein